MPGHTRSCTVIGPERLEALRQRPRLPDLSLWRTSRLVVGHELVDAVRRRRAALKRFKLAWKGSVLEDIPEPPSEEFAALGKRIEGGH